MKFYYLLIALILVACSSDSDSSPNPDNNGSNNGNDGQEVSLAIVNIEEISGITSNSAISGGSISNDGGGSITRKGIVWAISPSPDLTDNSTNDGSGPADYVSELEGLISATTYYVRAYATNSAGTAFSNELSFETPVASCSGVLENSIRLDNQAEVIEFGANNFCAITGSLEISGMDITDLSPLQSLESLGTLLIVDCDNLTSLSGLQNLISLGGLVISSNAGISDISALSQIESLEGGLVIDSNPSLSRLTGLESVTGTTDNVEIASNEQLLSIEELSGLTAMTGSLRITSNLSLATLIGLDNLETVNGPVQINQTQLTDLQGLNALSVVGERLRIQSNDNLVSLNGLENLISVNAELTIRFNDVISDFCSLTNLLEADGLVGELDISANAFNPSREDILAGNCSN